MATLGDHGNFGEFLKATEIGFNLVTGPHLYPCDIHILDMNLGASEVRCG